VQSEKNRLIALASKQHHNTTKEETKRGITCVHKWGVKVRENTNRLLAVTINQHHNKEEDEQRERSESEREPQEKKIPSDFLPSKEERED